MSSEAIDALAEWVREELESRGIDELTEWMRKKTLAGPKRKAAESPELPPALPFPIMRILLRDWLQDPNPSREYLVEVSRAVAAFVADELAAAAPDVASAVSAIRAKEEALRLLLSPLWKFPAVMPPATFEAFWELEAKWLAAALAGVSDDENGEMLEIGEFEIGTTAHKDYRRVLLAPEARMVWNPELDAFREEPRVGLWTTTNFGGSEEFYDPRLTSFYSLENLDPVRAVFVREHLNQVRGHAIEEPPARLLLTPGAREVEIQRVKDVSDSFGLRRAPLPLDWTTVARSPYAIYLGVASLKWFMVSRDPHRSDIEDTQAWAFRQILMPCADDAEELERPSRVVLGVPLEGTLRAAQRGGRSDELLPTPDPPRTLPTVRSMRNVLVIARVTQLVDPTPSEVDTVRALHAEFTSREPWRYDPTVPLVISPRGARTGCIAIPLALFLASIVKRSPTAGIFGDFVLVLPIGGAAWKAFVVGDRFGVGWMHFSAAVFPVSRAYLRKLMPKDVAYFPDDAEYSELRDAGFVFQSFG